MDLWASLVTPLPTVGYLDSNPLLPTVIVKNTDRGGAKLLGA